MCGSGTLAIEAALIAQTGRAPGLIRQSFGFMHTLLHDPAAWARLRGEAKRTARPCTAKIIATDIDQKAVAVARFK